MGNEIQKWADKAMFLADEIDPDEGPQVHLLSCNPDPLGTIAAAALMYEGKSVASLVEITDDQRRYYLDQVQRSVLEAPLEFVNFHFIISGVTRGFTHQMVRQRTATYTQESTRFAVKETVPVALPPSLIGTMPWEEWLDVATKQVFPMLERTTQLTQAQFKIVENHAEVIAEEKQLWRREWDAANRRVEDVYNHLVGTGMPAEDARGLLPTNLLTRINYNTSLRGLKDHAGVRLCTQAQFEWRQVWAQMVKAIRVYGSNTYYDIPNNQNSMHVKHRASSAWQFNALADIFKPICYYKGRCQFMSDVDRHCSIRDRVEQFANLGIPSTKWSEGVGNEVTPDVPAIHPSEWLMDPAAARISQ